MKDLSLFCLLGINIIFKFTSTGLAGIRETINTYMVGHKDLDDNWHFMCS